MIDQLKRPSAMIILPDSDCEKEATTRKRQRTDAPDSSTLQAALILALSAELHNGPKESTKERATQSSSDCHKSFSSLQRNFVTTGQVYPTAMPFSKNSSSFLTSQQFLDQCPGSNVNQERHDRTTIMISPSGNTSTRVTTTILLPFLPSGKPLLAPPPLPHLKLGERLSRRQKCA